MDTSGNSPLRIGIVGCGVVARNHVRGYTENADARVTQVFDKYPESAAKLASECGAKAIGSVEEMIGSGELDAVSICTPPASHTESCLPFLKAGIPVLCEKPLELNAERAEELFQAAEETGTPFMMAFTQRFHPPVAEAARILKSGVLGRPLYFRNAFGGAFDLKGNHRTNPAISGGGCVIDTASHSVDLFRLFMGEISSVTAKTAQMLQKQEIEDFGLILIAGTNGSFGEIMTTFSLPVVSNMLEVLCSEGTLTVNYYVPGQPDLMIQKRDEDAPQAINVSDRPFKFTAQIAHFLECVKKGTAPEVTLFDGLQSSRAITAAYQSAKLGKTVAVESGQPSCV